MEKPPLEKVLEKLGKIDIGGWEHTEDNYYSIFTTSINGLKVRLSLYSDSPLPKQYRLEIKDERGPRKIEYNHKSGKELIKNFYEKIYQTYEKFTENEFQEKLNSLVSE